MRKNLLAKSIATLVSGFALAGGAHAVIVTAPSVPSGVGAAQTLEVNTDGIGHSLLYPYFNAQGTNYTLFTVTNTDMVNGKAIKIRFRGAENSDDVYDLTVFLSPGDVWNAAITRGGNPARKTPTVDSGIARLSTADNSCTLPNKSVAAFDKGVNDLSFVLGRLPPNASDAKKANNTTEGYIELFNMADIPPTRTTAGGGGVNALFTAIKHGSNGVPPGCDQGGAVMQALANDPTDTATTEALGFAAPTTGLMGEWTIVNGPAASAWSGNAVAIEGRVGISDVPGYGNIVFFPQNNKPVASGLIIQATADPILRGGTTDNTNSSLVFPPLVSALNFDFPDMSTPYLTTDAGILANGAAARRQAYRLSRALAVTSISNEYVTGSGINAFTDWTLSSPSRRYNVARDYARGVTMFTNLQNDDSNALVPFVNVPPNATVVTQPTNFYTTKNTTSTTYDGTAPYGVICVTADSTSFQNGKPVGAAATYPTGYPSNLIGGVNASTEEAFVGGSLNSFVISPGTPDGPGQGICGEVSVMSFNAKGALSVLNAQITRFDYTPISPANAAGWERISTPGLDVALGQGLGGSTRMGLPIIGNAFIQFTNNNAAAGGAASGTIGNYDQTFPHRATRY